MPRKLPAHRDTAGNDAYIWANEGGFDGTIRSIFQPTKEWGQGAAAMLADGLLTRFPFAEIFGMHNMPGMPLGHFSTRAGPDKAVMHRGRRPAAR